MQGQQNIQKAQYLPLSSLTWIQSTLPSCNIRIYFNVILLSASMSTKCSSSFLRFSRPKSAHDDSDFSLLLTLPLPLKLYSRSRWEYYTKLPLPMALQPNAGHRLLILWGFYITQQRRTTIIRTPLHEWSARRRELYPTTHNRQTSMPSVGFETTISAGQRPETYALDRAATGTGINIKLHIENATKKHKMWLGNLQKKSVLRPERSRE